MGLGLDVQTVYCTLSCIQKSHLGSQKPHFIECNTCGCFFWIAGPKCVNCRVGVYGTDNSIVLMSCMSWVSILLS